MNEIVTIETFWENPGKRDGTLVVGLYELIYEVDSNGESSERWQPSLTTAQTGDVEISLMQNLRVSGTHSSGRHPHPVNQIFTSSSMLTETAQYPRRISKLRTSQLEESA